MKKSEEQQNSVLTRIVPKTMALAVRERAGFGGREIAEFLEQRQLGQDWVCWSSRSRKAAKVVGGLVWRTVPMSTPGWKQSTMLLLFE